MIDAALRAGLAAFDDAALTTLGNAGLVRRAHRDVEDGKLRLMSAGDGRATVEADGQTVTIDARGPRVAVCACKSVALCRHRIAAVLFLRQLGGDDTGPEEPDARPEEIVLGIEPAALERWAGRAAWRAALELRGAATGIEASANAVAVTFADLDDPVRILRGQGLDGVTSKVAKGRAKTYHAAAVLAARRHFGASPPDAAAEEVEAVPAAPEVDRAFLDRVRAALREVAVLGFNLAPLPLEESLFELSVSSRADHLPRLSAILRAIAAQLRLRRARALGFDPDRLLELAATAFALTRALAGADPDRRASLAGKVRRDFAPAAPLALIGCGGERWRTDTGARGVTAWFIDPATGDWLSTSLARGAGQDPGFDPAESWRSQPVWGAEPLAVLAHARITLEGSRRSDDGRLSDPAGARAVVIGRDVRPDADRPGVVTDWSDLRAVWLSGTGLGLDAAETTVACLLAPCASASPYFDDLAQQLVWPVRDVEGRWLALTLDQEGPEAVAIRAVEAHVRAGWKGRILARVARAGDLLEVRPITLFGPGEAVDVTLWRPPYSAAAGGRRLPDWLARLREGGGRRFARCARVGTDAALAAAWRRLLDGAETGPALARAVQGACGDGLAPHADRLDAYGLPTVAELLRRSGDAAGLLAAAYGLLVARRQRVGPPLLR